MTSTAASEALSSLQQVCLHAHRVCLETASQHLGTSEPDAALLQSLHDCAELTLATAHAAIRKSTFTHSLTPLCKEASQACARVLKEKSTDGTSYRVAYATCLSVCDACAEFDGTSEPAQTDRRDEIIEESFPASDPPPPPTEL